jgi:hypothetical protein
MRFQPWSGDIALDQQLASRKGADFVEGWLLLDPESD